MRKREREREREREKERERKREILDLSKNISIKQRILYLFFTVEKIS